MRRIFLPFLILILTAVILTLIFLKKEKVVRFTGYFEAKDFVLSSKVSSRLVEIRKKEGEDVDKGDTIIVLDSREIENKINESIKGISAKRERIKSIEIRIKRLKDNLISLKKIYEKGGGREKEIEGIEDEIESLEYERNSILKEISAIEEEIKNLYILKEECFIKSPCNGKIEEIYYEKGELAPSGFPLLKINLTDTLEFIFFVTQKYLPYLKIKDTVFIKPTPLNKKFKGKIKYISERAEFTPKNIVTENEKERMVFKVKAEVLNEDGILKPGMTGYVEWKR